MCVCVCAFVKRWQHLWTIVCRKNHSVSVSYFFQQETFLLLSVKNKGSKLKYPSEECCCCFYQPYSQWQHNISYRSKLRQHAPGQMQTEIPYRKLKSFMCPKTWGIRNHSLTMTHLPNLVSSLNCKTMMEKTVCSSGCHGSLKREVRRKAFNKTSYTE